MERVKYNWTLIKVVTDAGLTGIGEATNWPGSPLVEAACRQVAERIVGEDATRIDYLWTKLYRDMNWLGQAGLLMSAISAVDIALWDIAGKRAGLPLYELLGGAYRKQIQLYANYRFIRGDGSPESYREQALAMKAQGFTACKFDPFAHTSYLYGSHLSTNLTLTEEQKRLSLERLRVVSEALGADFPIAVETHAVLNGPVAVEMAHRIADMGINCLWYEEPAGPEFPDAIADIRRRIPLPVCVGERLHSRFMCLPVLERRAADVLMSDITRCGGVSEMKKIASLAECYNVPVAPHNPNGPVSTIASAHVMASVPNFFRQEFMVQDVAWRDRVLDRPLPVSGGFFHLDNRPVSDSTWWKRNWSGIPGSGRLGKGSTCDDAQTGDLGQRLGALGGRVRRPSRRRLANVGDAGRPRLAARRDRVRKPRWSRFACLSVVNIRSLVESTDCVLVDRDGT